MTEARRFVKERPRASAGSIPDVLDMFRSEVRFYREIAPMVDLRVPICFTADETDFGTRLELEDVSSWEPGADLVRVAGLLRELHGRWQQTALERWPWLRRAGQAADLIGDLYDTTWPVIEARRLPPLVRDLAEALVSRIGDAERAEAALLPHTLVHGDVSTSNLRTNSNGEVLFLDWEDVRYGPGVSDLAWLLVSSTPSDQWDDVIHAYGESRDLDDAMPAAVGQALLCLSGLPEDSSVADAWISRLESAALMLSKT